jgi:hypothetical protein
MAGSTTFRLHKVLAVDLGAMGPVLRKRHLMEYIYNYNASIASTVQTNKKSSKPINLFILQLQFHTVNLQHYADKLEHYFSSSGACAHQPLMRADTVFRLTGSESVKWGTKSLQFIPESCLRTFQPYLPQISAFSQEP